MARARDDLDSIGIHLELLVVDDSDTPETAEELISEGKLRDLQVTVIKGPGLGIGAAFVVGLEHALDSMAPQLLATMDCDGQHDATQLPSLVRAKLAGDDLLVIGSRFAEGSRLTGLTRARKLVSKVGNQLIRRLSHEDLPADATTSFRVFEPELARRFLQHGLVAGCTGYNFFSLFVLFAVINGPCREVPIHFRPRLVGSSKLTVQQCLQFARGLPDIRGRASQWERVNAAEPFGDATDIGCLQELARMPNYQRWIIEEIEPWLRGSVLEVGAGIGTMTPYLAAVSGVTDVCALEPHADAYGQLTRVCDGIEGASATLGTVEVLGDRRFDTVVYINCLEHIRDEEGELRRVQKHLAGPDAHLIIFSPALEFLYGELDRVSGHWRRYSRPSLLAAVQHAGYGVVRARYVDVLSIAPYWLSNRVLKRNSIGDMSIDIYDRYYVRAARLLHKAVRSPLGKSLMCIAVDPASIVTAEADAAG